MTIGPTGSFPLPLGNLARPGLLIAARSERQAMDWSLALASQEIACCILPPDPALGRGWALEVDPADSQRALRTLRTYHTENRRWRAVLQAGPGDVPFQWSVIVWCFLMAWIFTAADAPDSRFRELGSFSTSATAAGQWWRPLTATFLHATPDHLVANLTTGFLLLGWTMGRFGPGAALLGTLIAGVAGNLTAWAWRSHHYLGLGASGVIMGALGMLTVSLLADLRDGRVTRRAALRGVLGGIFLFILQGTSTRSDVAAHAGGFLWGAVIGLALAFLPPPGRRRQRFDLACALAYLALMLGGWTFALR